MEKIGITIIIDLLRTIKSTERERERERDRERERERETESERERETESERERDYRETSKGKVNHK